MTARLRYALGVERLSEVKHMPQPHADPFRGHPEDLVAVTTLERVDGDASQTTGLDE
jgi:hypothetical protein